MKKYHIENVGCDDYNEFDIELTDDEYKTVIKIFDENNYLASYGCCPHLWIYNYKDDGLYYDEPELNKGYEDFKRGEE